MITEDFVSYETAKLLKEKGFDEYCYGYYYTSKYITHGDFKQRNLGLFPDSYSAPTFQMAMKWLREVHSLFIGINTVISSDKNWGYEVFIQKQEIPIPSKIQWDWFNNYREAVEAAIKYCLENLI